MALDDRSRGAESPDGRAVARRALEIEAEALAALPERLDDGFRRAIDLLAACRGHVIVSGLGKSGLIGAKIAASLSSTGTPAFFIHAADALHGDAGGVKPEDTVLLISHSGTTAELVAFAEVVKDRVSGVVAMTGASTSPLAAAADAVIDIGVATEADPLGLVPTTSTTVTLALGDALVCALMWIRSTTREDFAVNHPAGALGRTAASEGAGAAR